MRRIGFLLGLLGLVMFIGGGVSLFMAYNVSTQGNEAGRLNLHMDQAYQSAAIHVDKQKLVRLAMRMRVSTRSVQETHGPGDRNFQGRYRFPLQVSVKDPEGKVLHSYQCELAWDGCGSRSPQNADIDSQGGSLQVTHTLDSFEPGPSGAVLLEVLLGNDRDYAASAQDIQLIVYDQIVSNDRWLISGFALCAFGPFVFIIGLLLFILAPVVNNTNHIPVEGEMLPAPDIRNIAMAVHLTALITWVGVPLGHIIAPLVVWLTQKDKSGFIDRHGKESLNFQLSITLYSIIALILCVVFIGFLLLIAIFIMHLTLSIIAAMRANEGQYYRYPMTIRFIR